MTSAIVYPYRTFIELGKIAADARSKIRNFFFCYIKKEQSFNFWEYEFEQVDNLQSIKLVQAKKFLIKVINENVLIRRPVKHKPETLPIPQADDVNKIIEFPTLISAGYDNSRKMTDAFGFVRRQSNYYRKAAEILGLVTTENSQFKLTPNGKKLLHLPSEEKSKYLCRLLLLFPIVDEIYKRVVPSSVNLFP